MESVSWVGFVNFVTVWVAVAYDCVEINLCGVLEITEWFNVLWFCGVDKSSLLSLVKEFDSMLAAYEGFCSLKQVSLMFWLFSFLYSATQLWNFSKQKNQNKNQDSRNVGIEYNFQRDLKCKLLILSLSGIGIVFFVDSFAVNSTIFCWILVYFPLLEFLKHDLLGNWNVALFSLDFYVINRLTFII